MTQRRLPAPLILALLLSACAVGPDYKRPEAVVPASFKEAADDWRPANPTDVASGAWWSLFGNAELDGLMNRVAVNNQNLAAAAAAYQQALAAVDNANAGFFPSINLNGSSARARTNLRSSTNLRDVTGLGGNASRANYTTPSSLSVGASWAPDIWGRVSRASEGATASAQASAAELAAARLSAQAALASAYFQLRGLDSLHGLLTRTVEAYGRSLTIARNQHAADIVSAADVAQAETQYNSAQAQMIAVTGQRATLEHAIAVLVGVAPAEFSLPVAELPVAPPPVPAALPASLLQRRPDIAAAERRVAAANAQIGVTTAAWFPNLTLTGSAGFSNSALEGLLKTPNLVWSLGPQLAFNLFDGGARTAAVEQARAAHAQQVAAYRQTVLTGLQQVEDQLSSLRTLAGQADAEARAVAAASEAERIFLNQYKAGTVSYANVVQAQTAALSARQAALTVQQNRLTATVALLEALGGGWNGTTPAP